LAKYTQLRKLGGCNTFLQRYGAMEMESLENKVEEEGDEDIVNGEGTILPIHATPVLIAPKADGGYY
jgi:hypothetical protein